MGAENARGNSPFLDPVATRRHSEAMPPPPWRDPCGYRAIGKRTFRRRYPSGARECIALFRRIPDRRRIRALLGHHRNLRGHFDRVALGVVCGPAGRRNFDHPCVVEGALGAGSKSGSSHTVISSECANAIGPGGIGDIHRVSYGRQLPVGARLAVTGPDRRRRLSRGYCHLCRATPLMI